MKKYLLVISLPLLFICGCTKVYVADGYEPKAVKVDENIESDESIDAMIKPYKDGLEDEMNEILVQSAKTMSKKKPESTLGNLMAEMIWERGETYYNQGIDISIVNYGGIRIPTLPEGDISKSKAYELMPFDNYLVVMELDGPTLAEVADVMANDGGWPIAGMAYKIKDNKAINITIGGEPFDITKTYSVVLSDYLANGGDNLSMLEGLAHTNLNVLFRDAIIDYFNYMQRMNQPLNANLDKRVSYAE